MEEENILETETIKNIGTLECSTSKKDLEISLTAEDKLESRQKSRRHKREVQKRYEILINRGHPQTLETKAEAEESLKSIPWNKISNTYKMPQNSTEDIEESDIELDENTDLEPEITTIRIMPVNFPTDQISSDQAQLIQEAILNKVLQQKLAQPKPQFTDCQYHSGFLTVKCCNKSTVTWLKEITETLTPYLDAKYIAIEEEDTFTKSETFEVLLPNSGGNKIYELVSFLVTQNSAFTMNHWTLLSRKNFGSSAKLTIAVKPKLNRLLKKRDYKLFYGFGMVKLEKPHEQERISVDRANRRSNPLSGKSTDERLKYWTNFLSRPFGPNQMGGAGSTRSRKRKSSEPEPSTPLKVTWPGVEKQEVKQVQSLQTLEEKEVEKNTIPSIPGCSTEDFLMHQGGTLD